MNTLESYSITSPKDVTDECAKFVIDDTGSPFILSEIMQIGTQYTFSFWIKSEATGVIQTCNKSFPSTAVWQKHSVVFTATGKDLTIGFLSAGTYYVYHPKLEIGNKVTDWSPAPEDVGEDIANATDDVLNDIFDPETGVVKSAEEIITEKLKDYVKTSEYSGYKEEVATQFGVYDDHVQIDFEKTTEKLLLVDDELKTEVEKRNKYISFSADNAITIGGNVTGIVLTVDNDNGLIFSKLINTVNSDSDTDEVEVTATSIAYQLHDSKSTAPTGTWSSKLPEYIPNDKFLWIRKSIYYSDGTTSYTDSVAFGVWDGNNFYTGNIVIRVDERAQFGNFAYVPRSDGSLSFLKVGE